MVKLNLPCKVKGCCYVAHSQPAQYKQWVCKSESGCRACMWCGKTTDDGECADEQCTRTRDKARQKARMEFTGPEVNPATNEHWGPAERPYGVLQQIHKCSLLHALRRTWDLMEWEDVVWIVNRGDDVEGPRVQLRRVECIFMQLGNLAVLASAREVLASGAAMPVSSTAARVKRELEIKEKKAAKIPKTSLGS